MRRPGPVAHFRVHAEGVSEDVLAADSPQDVGTGLAVDQPGVPAGMPDHVPVVTAPDCVKQAGNEAFSTDRAEQSRTQWLCWLFLAESRVQPVRCDRDGAIVLLPVDHRPDRGRCSSRVVQADSARMLERDREVGVVAVQGHQLDRSRLDAIGGHSQQNAEKLVKLHPDLRLTAIAVDLDKEVFRRFGGYPEMPDAAGALGVYQVAGLPRVQIDSPGGAMGSIFGGELDQGKDRVG